MLRSYNKDRAREQEDIHLALVNIYKGALAFRLLRFHGFDVTPGMALKGLIFKYCFHITILSVILVEAY